MTGPGHRTDNHKQLQALANRLETEIRRMHDEPFWDDVDDVWVCPGCEWTTRIVDPEFAAQAHTAHVQAIMDGTP